MEISEFRGFSEFSGMEDPSQWSFDSINMEAAAAAAAAAAFLDNTHDAPMFHHHMESPSQQLKSSWNSHYYPNPKEKEEGTVSSRSTLGFTSPGGVHQKTNNPPQDHILAERKRRQKLSQRFIALSALLPGLKKTDKASVLGDAINYLKNLQEKVKALEEQTAKSVESVVLVKRCDDGGGGEFISSSGERLPEVEARFSGKDVLIRIHCEKKTGVVEETLAELERLHLSVINTNAMAFATYALDITVVAQMNQEFTMTMKDLVKNLCARLKRFM